MNTVNRVTVKLYFWLLNSLQMICFHLLVKKDHCSFSS